MYLCCPLKHIGLRSQNSPPKLGQSTPFRIKFFRKIFSGQTQQPKDQKWNLSCLTGNPNSSVQTKATKRVTRKVLEDCVLGGGWVHRKTWSTTCILFREWFQRYWICLVAWHPTDKVLMIRNKNYLQMAKHTSNLRTTILSDQHLRYLSKQDFLQ